jgi:predicted transcriptional regulator
MKKFNVLQRIILKFLSLSSGKLDTYTLFKKCRLNFDDFSKAYRNLINRNIINETDNYAFITVEGEMEIKSIVSELQPQKKTWRQIPEEMLGDFVDVNSPYIPSRALLDKTSFNVETDQVN